MMITIMADITTIEQDLLKEKIGLIWVSKELKLKVIPEDKVTLKLMLVQIDQMLQPVVKEVLVQELLSKITERKPKDHGRVIETITEEPKMLSITG